MKRKLPYHAFVLVGLFLFAVIFGPFVIPHDPFETNLKLSILPPAWQEGGSTKYLLGTDSMGRDMLSRLIYGSRITLIASLVAICLAGTIGVMLGMISGYFGGKTDMAIMRTTDIFMSLPLIMMAIILASMLNPSLKSAILAIGLSGWTGYARIVRGEVLSLKEQDYVRLARVAGCSSKRILFSHILPNIMNTLIIIVTLQLGQVIIAMAALSFLGLGVQPPSATWGLMLSEGRKYITYAWWLATFPGIAILLTVLGFNLMGDWLRDTFDPKQKLR
ncbi:MAG: ABC transporter permease [Deltaproteobacteria bacterium]|nr:ABC transporter permease [Deltaproteobacteria bacterium]